jgi:hypothetical protein
VEDGDDDDAVVAVAVPGGSFPGVGGDGSVVGVVDANLLAKEASWL